MKDRILKYLLESTTVEGGYVGGGDEPQIVVFKGSEYIDREVFLTKVAEDIECLVGDSCGAIPYDSLSEDFKKTIDGIEENLNRED